MDMPGQAEGSDLRLPGPPVGWRDPQGARPGTRRRPGSRPRSPTGRSHRASGGSSLPCDRSLFLRKRRRPHSSIGPATSGTSRPSSGRSLSARQRSSPPPGRRGSTRGRSVSHRGWKSSHRGWKRSRRRWKSPHRGLEPTNPRVRQLHPRVEELLPRVGERRRLWRQSPEWVRTYPSEARRPMPGRRAWMWETGAESSGKKIL